MVATNAEQENEGDANLSVTARAANNDREPMDLDTLNTPAGKLVGVFLAACPSLEKVPDPFVVGTAARQMRDALIGRKWPERFDCTAPAHRRAAVFSAGRSRLDGTDSYHTFAERRRSLTRSLARHRPTYSFHRRPKDHRQRHG